MTTRARLTVGAVLAALALCIVLMRRTDPSEAHSSRQDHAAAMPGAAWVEPVPLESQPSEDSPLGRTSARASPLSDVAIVRLNVNVIDENEAPVPGVRILVVDETSAFDAGGTDATGSIQLGFISHEGWALRAEKDGYAPVVRLLPSPFPTSMVLRLWRSGAITGQVSWKDTGIPVPGATVLAFRDGHEPRASEIRQALSASPIHTVQVAVADEVGRYRIDGCAVGHRYTVRAATQGGVTEKALCGVRPDSDGDDLELSGFYGAVLHLHDMSGHELKTSPDFFGRGPSVSSIDVTLTPVSVIPPEFYVLTGERYNELELLHSRDPLVLLSSPRHGGRAGPVRFQVEVPGYEAIWTDVEVAAVEATLPEYGVAAKALAGQWGRLRIQCAGTFADVVPDSTTGLFVGTLQLRVADAAGGGALFIPIRKPCFGEHLISGIPFGSYTGVFVSGEWTPIASTRDRIVAFRIAESDASIALDSQDVGAVEVTLVDEWEEAYEGEAVFRIYRPGGDAYYSFRRAPFVLDGLEPGTYKLALERAPGVLPSRVARAEVRVAVGDVTPVTLHL